MAARRRGNLHFGVLLLALVIASILWGMAQGSSSIERGFDIPVELRGLPEDLVVTQQSAAAINVRVLGSRAALRNVQPTSMVYAIDVSGGKEGDADYEVDVSRLELPRNARPVSRSPSRIQVKFEPRARKAVSVRADVEGVVAPGYRLESVRPVPGRVWLVGARAQVMRKTEIATEPIDVAGLTESQEREVSLFVGSGTLWVEENKPVTVQIRVEPLPPITPEGGDAVPDPLTGEEAAG